MTAKVSTKLLDTLHAVAQHPTALSDPVRLTKRVVDRLKPEVGRDVVLWDSELPGFGLRVKPSGVRSYMVQYRNAGGRSRRLTLGRHGVLTPEQARDLAKQRLAEVTKGADPATERAAVRKAMTVAELAERYLKEHAETHNKPSSAREFRALLKRRILDPLGKLKAEAITTADVMRLHHSLRDTPYEANRTLALLSKLFNLAEAWKIRPQHSNPCTHVKRYAERKRERFLSAVVLSRLGAALSDAERTKTERPAIIAAIRLLAFTGCRRGEILSLQWGHVDLGSGLLRLADAKTGARIVPLGAPALELLRQLPQTGPFVVHGPKSGKPLASSTLEGAWWRLCKTAKIVDGDDEPNARIHDLRHTVGTYGGQAGLNAFMVRDLLGHKTLAMTARYVERDTDPLRAAADQVAGRIADAMAKDPSGNRR